MNRCFCDRCGKEIKEKSAGYIATNRRDRKNGDLQIQNKFEEKDFCVTCMNEIEKFIKTNPEAIKMKNEPEEKPETKEKKKVDIGKIMALKNAGWTNKSIAEEMGMTQNAVAVQICTHRKRQAAEKGAQDE